MLKENSFPHLKKFVLYSVVSSNSIYLQHSIVILVKVLPSVSNLYQYYINISSMIRYLMSDPKGNGN